MIQRIQQALTKTRRQIMGRMETLLRGKPVLDREFLARLEETLLAADLGLSATEQILGHLQAEALDQKIGDPEQFKQSLRRCLVNILKKGEGGLDTRKAKPFVILTVGVNGVGKTTTIAKLANRFRNEGLSVLLAAGDTFRAAATEQLEYWGLRLGIPVVKHREGSDPAAVVFDAITAAKARQMDVIIADTAGRLHTKSNLMEEIKKVKRVMGKALPGSPHEVLLVLDSTTGQNGLVQAREFHAAIGVTGMVVAKLDGTARGGVAVSIIRDLGIPIRFVGVGEGIGDLEEFKGEAFADGFFSYDSEEDPR